MRIVQKPSRFNKVEFEFGDRQLEYHFHGEEIETRFSAPYVTIGSNKSMLSFNARTISMIGGTIFMAAFLTFIAILFTLKDINSFPFSTPHFLHFVGFIVCLALVGIGISGFGAIGRRRDYTVIPAGPGLGNILILRNEQHQTIVDEITKRRISELKRIHGNVDTLNHPELEMKRFIQLKEQEIISVDEFNAARERIHAETKTPMPY